MTTVVWDPERYLAYADERGRPFGDLISRVPAISPRAIVDLGCGAGNLTRLLAQRWPDAQVSGVDSSAEMIGRARREAPGLSFDVADLRAWTPSAPVDVVVSNATLQWIPGHLDLLPRLVDAVRPGGYLAFQVPGNMSAPSHRVLDELATEGPYREHTRGVERVAAHDPDVYAERLLDLGCDVDAWETTYLHRLCGPDPVFTWLSGTGARPVLQSLDGTGLRDGFETELKHRLARAYPATKHGVPFAFRRIFVVAHRAAA